MFGATALDKYHSCDYHRRDYAPAITPVHERIYMLYAFNALEVWGMMLTIVSLCGFSLVTAAVVLSGGVR